MDFLYKKVGDYQFDPKSTLLGKGIFGEVYLGEHSDDPNIKVAIKVVSSSVLEANKEHLKLFLREVEVLKGIKGKHVLELLDAIQTASGNLYLVTNYCNGGNLEMLLYKEKKISVEVALKYLYQITEAFEELANLDIKDIFGRKMTIMHRDIKPSNILLHNGEIVIADFGFAKFTVENEKGIKRDHTKLGTPLYMAPQILARADYSYKCDVWSTAVVIYELIFGKKPWEGASIHKLLDNIRNQPLKFPAPIPQEVEDLLSKMLVYDDRNRFSWKEVSAHPAFELLKKNKNIDIDNLAKKDDTQNLIKKEGSKNSPAKIGRIEILSQEPTTKEAIDAEQKKQAQADQIKLNVQPTQEQNDKANRKSKIKFIEDS